MDNTQESSADIIAEMRNLGKLDEKSIDKIPRTLMGLGLRTYADRLDAAMKREKAEIEADALAAGGIVEASRRETSGNAATAWEALACIGNALNNKMMTTPSSITEHERMIMNLCLRTFKENPRPPVGSAAAMREALSDACYAMFNFLKAQNGGYEEIANALDKAKAALSAPPRNCDVGTAEEQAERYGRYCDTFTRDGMHCETCPCCGKIPFGKCEFAYAQLPYEEGVAK